MEYKKPQPLITISVIFIIASVGIAYYLDKPLYAKVNEQEQQIKTLQKSSELKTNYEKQIREVVDKLNAASWEQKKEKIKTIFDSSPFFLSKAEIFFRDIVIKSGVTLSSITFDSASSIKTIQQSQTTNTETSQSKSFKPQEEQGVASVQTAVSEIKGPVNKVGFTLTVTGSYNFFKLLLENMEKQAFLISIKNINFGQSESADKTTFTIKGNVYSY
ncbi:MAG: hypothetical protein PHI45_01525 [Candidatus Pacebacteria bacterium]|nr:hypothetical protein [Candidatus Paceibacterota bacterium]MDD5013289.1 hypothetical protein [Candidatus Paceibacterota bacterium]MDD5752748.1 hypothetical protein [Candidatus Paceibacterota bacterium]